MNETSDNSKTSSRLPNRIRRALPIWAQLLVLLTMFGAGYVVGSMVTTKNIHSKMEAYRNDAPIFAEDIVSRLRFRLRLSEEQVPVVSEIVERRHQMLVESRKKSSQEMHKEFDSLVAEVAGVLDETQVERWHLVANMVRARFLPPSPSR